MTPEDWERVEAWLADALELPPGARPAFLEQACGSEGALRAEVEDLIRQHEEEPDFLERPVPSLLADLDPHESRDDAPPAAIGPYRILRPLGRGGMGHVWLAEREAPGFRQQVALKVLRRGLDTDDLLVRFRAERQILARLDHPNIARLLDVGSTAEGLPYFVMEYVPGVSLVELCRSRSLDVRERIGLFRTVCSAVQYAHRNLIVHRDLKPGNILVGEDGVPKLLDFGIAKILQPDGEAESPDAHLTRADVRLLTPGYSAPEQILGEPITTACDVYTLGVLLYELLTGRHPYRVEGGGRAEMERWALEVDPAPPSSVVEPPRRPLAKELAGDLDNIVLRAIRKEPEARYESVQALSDDLDRHLAGLPVRARPATLLYRTRKFVARNRLSLGVAASVFLVLAASTGAALHQARLVREQSARVARERDKALQVRSFLLEMFGTTGPDQPTGDTVTARELLDRRAATLAETYPDDPEMRAEIMSVLAEGYDHLGLTQPAETLATDALEMRRALLGPAHPDVAASLNLVGWLQRERGELAAAEATLSQAVAMGREVFPAEGDPHLARALNDLGAVLEARGRYQGAAELYRESLEMRRRLQGEEQVGVAVTTSNLAAALYHMGDLEEAVATAETAVELFRRVLGPDHQRTLIVQSNLAAMQSARGDHAGAARQHGELLERRTRLFGPRHPSVPFSMTMLAHSLEAMGRSDEARTLLDEALALQRDIHGELHLDVASTLRVRGDVALRAERYAEALEDFGAALAIVRRLAGSEHPSVGVLLGKSARALEGLGRLAAAERSYRDALRLAETLGERHPQALDGHLALVEFLMRRGRSGEAGEALVPLERLLADPGAGTTGSEAEIRRRAAEARASAGRRPAGLEGG